MAVRRNPRPSRRWTTRMPSEQPTVATTEKVKAQKCPMCGGDYSGVGPCKYCKTPLINGIPVKPSATQDEARNYVVVKVNEPMSRKMKLRRVLIFVAAGLNLILLGQKITLGNVNTYLWLTTIGVDLSAVAISLSMLSKKENKSTDSQEDTANLPEVDDCARTFKIPNH